MLLHVAAGDFGRWGNVELVVDVVGRNVFSPYGVVVHGVGAVEPGGVAYTARSVSGVVGSRGVRLSAGRELVVI